MHTRCLHTWKFKAVVVRVDKEIFYFYLKIQADMLKKIRHKVTLCTNTVWKSHSREWLWEMGA